MRFPNPFRAAPKGPSNNTKPSFYNTFYPESVRYALSYNASRMGPSEIRALIPNFTDEAMYLILKALIDREAKRQFLEDLTITFIQPDYQKVDLQTLLADWVQRIPQDSAVKGTKLAQLGRLGSSNWQNCFRNLAETCYTENKEALPCLIAHTALLGFKHFVQLYRDVPRAHIMVLVPEWLMDPNDNIMGYAVQLDPEPQVALKSRDECLVRAWACQGVDCPLKQQFCGSAYFIDDTIHSGKTAGKLTSFWYSEYGLSVPDDRIRVITDLRKSTTEH